MPDSWRAHVIVSLLFAEGIPAEVVLRDLYTLVDAERHAVLDAMLREQAEPPMALVEGVVACVGGYDIDAILAAARRLR